jgi:hypothetical protein
MQPVHAYGDYHPILLMKLNPKSRTNPHLGHHRVLGWVDKFM